MLRKLSRLVRRRSATDSQSAPHRSHVKAIDSNPPAPSSASQVMTFGEWHPVHEHADETVKLARELALEGSILADHMREIHAEMCSERGWLPQKWNPVARAISLRTTGGKKVYAYVNGRRLRIYPLRPITGSQGVETVPRHSGTMRVVA